MGKQEACHLLPKGGQTRWIPVFFGRFLVRDVPAVCGYATTGLGTSNNRRWRYRRRTTTGTGAVRRGTARRNVDGFFPCLPGGACQRKAAGIPPKPAGKTSRRASGSRAGRLRVPFRAGGLGCACERLGKAGRHTHQHEPTKDKVGGRREARVESQRWIVRQSRADRAGPLGACFRPPGCGGCRPGTPRCWRRFPEASVCGIRPTPMPDAA